MNLKNYHDELMCFTPNDFPLKSIMFYGFADKVFHLDYILNVKSGEKRQKFAEELEIMDSYVTTNKCRRTQLMRNSSIKKETQVTADCCDNCVEKIIADTPITCFKSIDENGQLDISSDVLDIIYLLMRWTENKRNHNNETLINENDLIHFHLGIHISPRCVLAPYEFFRKGAEKSFDYWKSILKILKDEKYISADLQPTKKSYNFIFFSTSKKFKVCPRKKMLLRFLKRKDVVEGVSGISERKRKNNFDYDEYDAQTSKKSKIEM